MEKKLINFEKVSLNQIETLFDLLAEADHFETVLIKKRYKNWAINFEETVNSLRALKLVDIKENKIIASKILIKFFKKFKQVDDRRPVIKDFIAKVILTKGPHVFNSIKEYFKHFVMKDDIVVFEAQNSIKLKYSGVRDFLIELGLLHLDLNAKQLRISKEHWQEFLNISSDRRTSLENFNRYLKDKKELGKITENGVIKYERKRLSQYPKLMNMIEHVSIKNVNAGYDILSFEIGKKGPQKYIKRYIEVKGVSPFDYKFYWTKNELQTSLRLKGKYYLYLVPVLNHKNLDIDNLLIIKNPYQKIFHNKFWKKEEELYSFSMD